MVDVFFYIFSPPDFVVTSRDLERASPLWWLQDERVFFPALYEPMKGQTQAIHHLKDSKDPWASGTCLLKSAPKAT